MLSPDEISDSKVKEWYAKKLGSPKALIIEHFDGTWSRVFSRNLIQENIPVVIISLFRDIDIPDRTCIKVKLNITTNEIDYKALEKLLIDHNIGFVFQHASFERPYTKISDYIESRNSLIEQYKLPVRPIDIFHFEGGFLRPSLYQLDCVGWNLWNSMTDESFPNISQDQETELDKWLVRFREEKTRGTIFSKQDLCEKFNIPPNKSIVLCGMQVPGDSVLLHFSPWCNTPSEFIENCIKIFPSDRFHLIFRRHPKDTEQSMLVDLLQMSLPDHCTFLPPLDGEAYDSGSFLPACDVVCVVNSTLGCEALAFDKPVVNLGFAAYRSATIPCYNDDSKTIEKMLQQIDRFSEYRVRVRNLLYHIITNSPGLRGLSFKDLVNKKSRYHKI